jgi:hypothetical protein
MLDDVLGQRARQIFQRLNGPAKLVAAAAAILPDGPAKRWIGGTAGLVTATADVIRGGELGHDGWQSFRCEITAAALAQYGETVTRGNTQMLMKLGEHTLVTDQYNPAWMRSESTKEDVVRTVAELSIATMTGAERLRLTETGLHDDGHVPEHQAGFVREVEERMRAELASGASSRTLLLVGPPGSGKSIAARQLASRMGELVLTLTSALLIGEHHESAIAFIEALRPDAVVIDDYDRRGDSDGISLDLMDRLRAAARVVIFTANSVSSFTSAELRPGRFDRIVYVTKLDAETARMIGGDLPESIREEALNGLLAGYLHELVVRVRGGADAQRELAELLKRQQDAEHSPTSVPSPRVDAVRSGRER